MTFAAITTSCVALFLTGGSAFAFKGINEYASTLPSRFEMRVFLKDDAKKADVDAAIAALKKNSGVDTAIWVPKDKAWTDFQKSNPSLMVEGLENPLPEAITVTLKEIKEAERVAQAAQKLPQVAPDGVQYLKRERDMLDQALGLMRVLGLTLGLVMIITSATLIFNAIRVTIVARRKEFRIMSLVGATASTVVIPLMIEGAVTGLIGGLLAALLVQGTHWYLSEQLQAFSGIIKLGPLSLQPVALTLGVVGGTFGLVCSMVAVKDYRAEV